MCVCEANNPNTARAPYTLQCARALLAGAAQTPAPCLLPHVSVLSHRDVTERDKGEVELYRHHGFGSTPPRRVFGSP